MNQPTPLRSFAAAAAALLALAACDAAEGVQVQELPPLDRPSPEARRGLPEMEGAWRFAGWELPSPAAAEGADTLARPGDFVFRAQRLDSIAGEYRAPAGTLALVGEVRRDRAISVVGRDAEGVGRFAAGIVSGDTLWVELSSFEAAQAWPAGTRGAWVRGTPPAQPLVWLRGGGLLRDTTALDSLAMPGDTLLPADTLGATVQPAPAQPAPVQPAPRPAPQQPAPQPRPAPREVAPEPRPDTPAPRPAPRDTVRLDPRPAPPRDTARPDTAPRRPPRLLGAPRDTIRIPPR